MFSLIESELKLELSAVSHVASWNVNLRDMLNGLPNASGQVLPVASAQILLQMAPNAKTIKVFDHCASISRIYALFEDAVCKLVTDYLRLLPELCPKYEDLPIPLRLQHRMGTSYVMSRWGLDSPQYSKIPEKDLAKGYYTGLSTGAYELLPEAFLTDTENFRADVLTRVFSKLGISDIYKTVSEHYLVENFKDNYLGTESLDSYLSSIVKLRNEAAHGDVNVVSNWGEIARYAEFLSLIFLGLCEATRATLLPLAVKSRRAKLLGRVVKRYSGQIVGIEVEEAHLFATGDTIWAGTDMVGECRIASVGVNGDMFHWSYLHVGEHVGLALDRKLRDGAFVYILS